VEDDDEAAAAPTSVGVRNSTEKEKGEHNGGGVPGTGVRSFPLVPRYARGPHEVLEHLVPHDQDPACGTSTATFSSKPCVGQDPKSHRSQPTSEQKIGRES